MIQQKRRATLERFKSSQRYSTTTKIRCKSALENVGDNTEGQAKLARLATELTLGPLRASQLILESLHDTTEEEGKKIRQQFAEFAEAVSSLLVSPILLFTSDQFKLPDEQAKDISKRIPYLHAISSLMEVNYFDKISQQIVSVTSAWPSGVQISNLENLLRLVNLKANSNFHLLGLISLAANIKEREALSLQEYNLLNVIHLLSSLSEYLIETNGNITVLTASQEGEGVKSQQKVEKILSPSIELLSKLFEKVFSGIYALGSKKEESQEKRNGLVARKNYLLNDWFVVLRSVWLGLTSFLALYGSDEIYTRGTNLIFESFLKHSVSEDLPVAIREQFLAAFCEVPDISQSFTQNVLGSKSKVGSTTVARSLQSADLSTLKNKIQELDVISTVNSFVKKIAQEGSHIPLKYVQESIKGFYGFLHQNNSVRLNIEKLANYADEIQDLVAKISQKDIKAFLDDIIKYIRDIILSQLTRAAPKDSSSTSNLKDQKTELVSLLKDIQSKSFGEDSSLASSLLSSLAKAYNSISQYAQERLDWNQLQTEDYPISEEILIQVVQSFKILASELIIKESETAESDLVAELADLLEGILYDLRASLSYYFLQDKKNTKQLQQSLISFISESVLDSISKNKSISSLLDRVSTVRRLWIALYNLVLVNPNAMNDVVQQGLLAKLLSHEYPSAINWQTSGLALFVFEPTMQTSLPLRELIEVSIKREFCAPGSTEHALNPFAILDLIETSDCINDTDIQETIQLFKVELEDDNPSLGQDPHKLNVLQTLSLDGSARNIEQEQPNLIEGILQRLSSGARQLLDTLILTAISNYAYATVQSLDDTPKRRRLTIEILQQLHYISVKYPHVASYIFLKQIDAKILQGLGLPNQRPYSKLLSGETFSFLDFILRVSLKQDKGAVFPMLDFVDMIGIPADVTIVDDNNYTPVDLMTVLLSTTFELIGDIIDEDLNSGQADENLDSVELTRTIVSLIEHYLYIKGSISFNEKVKLIGPTTKKILKLLVRSLANASENVYSSYGLKSALLILAKQLDGEGRDMPSDRSTYYFELIKAYEGSSAEVVESPEIVRSRRLVDNLLGKRRTDLTLREDRAKNDSEILASKQSVETTGKTSQSKSN